MEERKRIAEAYQAFFQTKSWAKLPLLIDETRVSCNHLFALRINEITEAQRDFMIEDITAAGVAVNVHFIPMPMLSLFKNLGYRIEDYPKALDNYSREISLPIYPQLTNEQIDYICEAVLASYNKVVLND